MTTGNASAFMGCYWPGSLSIRVAKKNAVLQSILICCFTVVILFCCRKPGVTGRGLYELKEEYLKEYNPFFYHYTRIEQSKVHSYVTANEGKWFQLCQRNFELIVHIVMQSFLVNIYKQAHLLFYAQ